MIKRYLSLLLSLCLLVGMVPGYASAAGAPDKPYLESGWVKNYITVPFDAPDADRIHDVIYADGKFMTVGGMLGISYDNGLTYTFNRPTIFTSYGITYGNGIFVAVGEYGEIKTSFDGENWMVTKVADFPSVDNLNSVTYGNGVYVAVGNGGMIMTSIDSFSWIDQRSGVTSNLNSVTYGNGKFMAVGENGTMLTSDDGLIWDIQASGTTNIINDVIYADGSFVSVGRQVAIVTSNDGERWSSDLKLETSQYFESIIYYNNVYFAVSHSGIQVSSNLIDWTKYYVDNVGISAIAASNDTIVLGTDDYISRKVVPPLYAFTYDGNGHNKGDVPYQTKWYAEVTGWYAGGTEWYAEGDEIWIAGNDYKLGKDGYTTTTYWNTSADGNGLAYSSYYDYNDKVIMGKDNITLYAQYTKDGDAGKPAILTQPIGTTVTEGDASPTLSIDANRTDTGIGSLLYQWYRNTTDSDIGAMLIDGAISDSYSVPTVTTGTTYYYVVVTSRLGDREPLKYASTPSFRVAVVVNVPVNAATPVIGTEPTGATVTVGDVSPTVSVVATKSDSGTLSYQWFTNTTSSNTGGTLITEATSATYSVSTGTAGTTYYYVEVTNTNGAAIGAKTATATSSVVEVVVNAAPLVDAYTVTYDGNESTGGSVPVSSSYEEGALATVAGNTGTLVKAGNTFIGWNTKADGTGTPYSEGTKFPMDKENLILYAQWTAEPTTYTITYDGNESTGGSVPVSSSYEEGALATVVGNTGTLVKAGHSFNGWNTTADGTGTPHSAGSTFSMGKSNLTLYAQWTTNPTYTITYDGNESTGGSVPVSSSYEEGALAAVVGNTGTLVKAGNTFIGWNTTADGTGTPHSAGSTFSMGK